MASETNNKTVSVESLSKTLQPYLLFSDAMETGEVIGRGAYGTVYKVRRWGTICAAKKLHEFPLQVAGQKGGGTSSSSKQQNSAVTSSYNTPTHSEQQQPSQTSSKSRTRNSAQHSASAAASSSKSLAASSSSSASGTAKDSNMMAKFEKECHLLSNLRHPYIVQFLGVYIEKASGAPVIVMEYLPTSLAACVQTRPNIPRYLQISMLHNVALGLAYLHGHSPPIIHRDLTANNVLLTSNMVAKIADLGVARMLDLTPKRAMQLTQAPGTAAYMPPEALAQNPSYNTKIDCFSFGVLVLHLVSQMWPIPTEPVKVSGSGKLTPVSEFERRRQQIDLMGADHCLYKLTSECLQNDSSQRPETSQIVVTLEALQSKFPLPSTSYLDLLQVLESNRNQLEAKGVQLAANKQQLQTISLSLEDKDKVIADLKDQVKSLEKQLAGSLKKMLLQNEGILTENGETEENGATSPDIPSVPTTPTELIPSKSAFVWRKDAELPTGMFSAKGIILDDKLYIGGGDTKDLATDCVVYEYDINGLVRKWTAIPAAPVCFFSLANVNNRLTLVGGMTLPKKTATNLLHTWDKEQQKWRTMFPAMLTARHDCMVTTFQLWLLVAGGLNFKKPIYNVELFDCSSYQWTTIHPLPKPSVGMTSCIIKNTWYLLGGSNFTEPIRGESGPKEYVFALKLDENVATNKWTTIPETPHYCSTAVPFGDFLMAIGGTDSLGSRSHSPSMFMYSPALERWLYVGNIPTSRSHTTCVVLSKGRMIILGGQESSTKHSRLVEILQC